MSAAERLRIEWYPMRPIQNLGGQFRVKLSPVSRSALVSSRLDSRHPAGQVFVLLGPRLPLLAASVATSKTIL